LLLVQALLLGAAGTLVGLPVGVALAWLLVRVHEWFLGVALPGLPLIAWPLVLAGLLGPAMTLLATFAPARRAARRPPLADLALRGSAGGDGPARWPVALGVALLAGVLLFEALVVFGRIPPSLRIVLLPLASAGCLVGGACVLPA